MIQRRVTLTVPPRLFSAFLRCPTSLEDIATEYKVLMAVVVRNEYIRLRALIMSQLQWTGESRNITQPGYTLDIREIPASTLHTIFDRWWSVLCYNLSKHRRFSTLCWWNSSWSSAWMWNSPLRMHRVPEVLRLAYYYSRRTCCPFGLISIQ